MADTSSKQIASLGAAVTLLFHALAHLLHDFLGAMFLAAGVAAAIGASEFVVRKTDLRLWDWT
jgi:hypothetical protein